MKNKGKWAMRTINFAWLGLFVFSVFCYITGTVDEKIFILELFMNMNKVMFFTSIFLMSTYGIIRLAGRVFEQKE